MEELQQGNAYVCKICSKSCVSGMSLGGHMRIHLAVIAASKKAETKTEFDVDEDGDDRSNSDENVKNPEDLSSYVLRENPKKSWRISDHPKHGLNLNTENRASSSCCKECGKDFPSPRALSGHMRSHSIKNNREANQCKTCGKKFDSMRAMFGHMKTHSKKLRVCDQSTESLSDLENFCPVRRKRSRIRYKGTTTQDNASVSVSAASDLEEIMEVASSLIMLSRGVNDNWVKIESVDDCEKFCGYYGDFVCDDNKKVSLSNGKFGCCSFDNANGFSDLKNVAKFDGRDPRVVIDDQDEMGFSFEVAANDDKVFVLEDKTKKVDFQVSDDDNKDLFKSNSCNKAANLEIMNGFDETIKKKKKKARKCVYKCSTCGKILHSSRALGRHNAMHKLQEKTGLVPSSVTEADSTDVFDQSESQHECPICFKVFPSGQALGGHKRAHYGLINESKIQEEASMVDEGSKSMWWEKAESLVLTN